MAPRRRRDLASVDCRWNADRCGGRPSRCGGRKAGRNRPRVTPWARHGPTLSCAHKPSQLPATRAIRGDAHGSRTNTCRAAERMSLRHRPAVAGKQQAGGTELAAFGSPWPCNSPSDGSLGPTGSAHSTRSRPCAYIAPRLPSAPLPPGPGRARARSRRQLTQTGCGWQRLASLRLEIAV